MRASNCAKSPASTGSAIVCAAACVLAAACSIDLQQVECVSSDDCQGRPCVMGICQLEDAAGDAAGDGDAASDADGGAPDSSGEDLPDDAADGADLAPFDADLGPDARFPDTTCPEDVDCLDGIDSDDDGTDGTARFVIYVDPEGGSDVMDGTTPERAIASLARALELVEDRSQILLAAGEHPVSGTQTITRTSFVEIGGGYDPDDWSRTSEPSVLLPVNEVPSIPLLHLDGIGLAILSQVVINGSDGDSGACGSTVEDEPPFEARSGQTSIALQITDSVVVLRDGLAKGGRGGLGGEGRFGRPGADGNPGNPPLNLEEPAAGGVAGDGAICRDGSTAYGGGDGGAGDGSGTPSDGLAGDGPTGGAGGAWGTTATGGDGDPGDPGANGIGGGPYGYIREVWHPAPGQPGRPGLSGGGGGGGASGMAEGVAVLAGGGGGSGGCGGEGGGGGGGGGGSIAVFASDSSLGLESFALESSRGGDGGNGGSPGDPGEGGGPGAGAGLIESDLSGRPGGTGGAGGPGGDGGGGQGGISVPLVLVGNFQLRVDDDSTLTAAEGGDPGETGELPDRSYGLTGFSGRVLGFPGVESAGGCPAGTIGAPASDRLEGVVCLDLYEASADSVVPEGAAVVEVLNGPAQSLSLPEFVPWTDVTRETAAAACNRGGGFLCSLATLQSACAGTPPDDCNFGGILTPTGIRCHNNGLDDLVWDLLGNAAEWVSNADPSGSDIYYGLSYQDAIPGENACESFSFGTEAASHIGFRCCKSPAFLLSTEFIRDSAGAK